jgi:hypothetical protein
VKNCLIIFLLFAIFSVSCKKKKQTQNEVNHPVPNVFVDVLLYPGDPLNYQIQTIGGWKYINGGINGIILYRKSQQEFVALERTSSYFPDNTNAKVKVQADNFSCLDSISGSKWQIIDGTIANGPAQWPLRVYGTSFDGSTLRIRNL